MPRTANFEIVKEETTTEQLVIRDLGPWNKHPTITNDAENVVGWLASLDELPDGRRLLYYDSDGQLDEIVHKDGVFVDFKPLPK